MMQVIVGYERNSRWRYFSKVIFIGLVLTFTIVVAGERLNHNSSKNQENKILIIKDYGTRGNLFPIKERSILEEIIEKLQIAKADGTLDELQSKFTEKVKAKVLRPTAVPNLTKAITNRSWTYSPTYTQKTDIVDHKGRLIVEAGASVNGLEKLQWGEPLIFIDGDDELQVKWAKAQSGKITLTNGAPLDIAKKLNRRVYFDQGGILCHRFKIEAMPAIVEQEGLLLKVSEVKI